jgi:hypothetical protein
METRMKILGLAVTAGLLAMGSAAQAQQKFDGRWSVLVLTEKGECDKAYRYPIAIEKGRVRYAGEASFSISGQVATSGAVQGNITSPQGRADVRGRLSGASGAGTWTVSGSRNCSGRWEAEKRG